MYASSAPPFVIDEWWQGQLGEIETRRITRECNLFILALSEDAAVDEKYLEKRVTPCYLSLLLQGVGYTSRGSLLFGEIAADGMRVSGLGTLDNYYASPKVLPADVSEEHFQAAALLAQGVDAIFPENNWREDFLRLRKGFNAWLDAIKHRHAHQRLHQSVRSLEAVIKPNQGDGTKKFKYRCQFFTGRKPNDVKLLEELYELRCAAEHLNPLANKLGEYPAHEHDNLKALRAYQAELLASFVYRKILLRPDIITHLKDDQSITDLWTSRDTNALISFWGDTIDLQSAPKAHFHDYL